MSADGETPIVGEIGRSKTGEPFWRVIRHEWDLQGAPANTRPCGHGHFTLDEKWKTVTCSECGERLDPFAVIMAWVDWWGRMTNHAMAAEQAEASLHREELRRLSRLRACTPDQSKRIAATIAQHYHEPAELKKLIGEIHKELRPTREA